MPIINVFSGHTHTPKSGKLESSRTPKNLELDCKGQNTSHWSVFYVIGKVLKCRCPKWPCMSHLDIFSPSYGQKKGWESNWQFDSQPLKVGNRLILTSADGVQHGVGKLSKKVTRLLRTSSQSEVWIKSYRCPKSQECKSEQFQDSTLGIPWKIAIRM